MFVCVGLMFYIIIKITYILQLIFIDFKKYTGDIWHRENDLL